MEQLLRICDFQVFGRGGEEMDFLRQQGIQVNIIPGMILYANLLISPSNLCGLISLFLDIK